MEDYDIEKFDDGVLMQSPNAPVAESCGETEDSEEGLTINEILTKREARSKRRNEPSQPSPAAADVEETSKKEVEEEADEEY